MKQKFGKLYLFLAILFLVLFHPFTFFLKWAHSPSKELSTNIVYYVAEGKSLNEVAYALKNHNILTHPELFKLYTKLTGYEKKIKFGTFIFYKNMTPAQILDKLASGDTVKIKVTIPEGLNIYQISQKLSEAFPQYDKSLWINLMFDKNLIALLPLQEAYPKSIEGFLFPDTYFFDPNEKPDHIVQSFISHFKQMIPASMFKQAKALNLTPLQFITLASIIQKESAVESELSEISAVFFNRLHLKMRLQSDPTVIYGVWDEYKGRITKKHLRTKNQYNTYIKYGLPVGPIANSGLSSFKAVLNPAQSNALYFVAVGDGTHVFSESYTNHRKAVKKYIQYLRTSRYAR